MKATGYQIPLIHSGNKKEIIYEALESDQSSKSDQNHQNLRQNLIIMGDICEDAHMADKEKHEQILKVGFFNEIGEKKSDESFAKFEETFDLLILNDGSMLPVKHILEDIFGQPDISDENLTRLNRVQGSDQLL